MIFEVNVQLVLPRYSEALPAARILQCALGTIADQFTENKNLAAN
jgi:hypothetical protein